MKMRAVDYYKGYGIRVRSSRLRDTDKWNTEIVIEREVADKRFRKKFVASNQWDDEKAAIAGCIQFGRRIIDGEVEGCTVDF